MLHNAMPQDGATPQSDTMPRGTTMPQSNIYSEALMEHVTHPDYNYVLDDATCTHEGINPSCGDDLTLHVRLADNTTIDETSWTGSGCAISQASADIMSEVLEGKTIVEARDACALFVRMIRGEETDANTLSQLEDASCFQSISYMPARVKCAELAWRTLDEMLKQQLAEKCDGEKTNADKSSDPAVTDNPAGR